MWHWESEKILSRVIMRNGVFTSQNSSHCLLEEEKGSSRWFSKKKKREKTKLINVISTEHTELIDSTVTVAL